MLAILPTPHALSKFGDTTQKEIYTFLFHRTDKNNTIVSQQLHFMARKPSLN
jgi:hypothetical protein